MKANENPKNKKSKNFSHVGSNMSEICLEQYVSNLSEAKYQ